MDISEHLRALEMELLSPAVRKSSGRIAALLADDFREFGSSGRVYTKKDIILTLLAEPSVTIISTDFKVLLLSAGVALVTYRSFKGEQEASPSIALRSSVWMLEGESWKMIFHQGTRLPHSEQHP